MDRQDILEVHYRFSSSQPQVLICDTLGIPAPSPEPTKRTHSSGTSCAVRRVPHSKSNPASPAPMLAKMNNQFGKLVIS